MRTRRRARDRGNRTDSAVPPLPYPPPVKVFISWSKEPSRTIAAAIAEWLKTIVQVTAPWMSDRDIRSGRRWREVIGSALQDTDVGIICLTRTNQHEPWLMFEAGALAKLDHAQVIPLYIDIEPAAVVGPLEDWQGRKLDRDGMWQVVYDINAATQQPVPEDSLRRLFDLTWPQLEAAVEIAKAKQPEAHTRREPQSMLEELVERVRRLERNQPLTARFAPGDTVTIRDRTFFVQSEEDARRLEQLLAVERLVEGSVSVVSAGHSFRHSPAEPADEDTGNSEG